jgi:redox-sensitive bicupin YhaK (pirin superfamily)
MGESEGVQIQQNAWFSMGSLDAGADKIYKLHKEGNGIYAFVLEGDVHINDVILNRRDGLGITDTKELSIKPDTDARILLIEVPINF